MSPEMLNQIALALDDRLDYLQAWRDNDTTVNGEEWVELTEEMDVCMEAIEEVAQLVESNPIIYPGAPKGKS
jgi:hypothetical protein